MTTTPAQKLKDAATMIEMGATPAQVEDFLANYDAIMDNDRLGENLSPLGQNVMKEFRQQAYKMIQIANPVAGGKKQPASFVLRQMAEGAEDVPEIATTLNAAADALDTSLAFAHSYVLHIIESLEKYQPDARAA
jgi:hypothetical protein